MQSAAETVPVLEEDADGLKTEGPVIYIELDKPSASAGKEPEYMGVFTVSAYCGCSQCLGEKPQKADVCWNFAESRIYHSRRFVRV